MDIHASTARAIFGENATAEERERARTINAAAVYGSPFSMPPATPANKARRRDTIYIKELTHRDAKTGACEFRMEWYHEDHWSVQTLTGLTCSMADNWKLQGRRVRIAKKPVPKKRAVRDLMAAMQRAFA